MLIRCLCLQVTKKTAPAKKPTPAKKPKAVKKTAPAKKTVTVKKTVKKAPAPNKAALSAELAKWYGTCKEELLPLALSFRPRLVVPLGDKVARSRSSFLLHPKKGKRHDHRGLLFFDVVVQKARTTRSIETTRTRTRKVRAERDKAQEMMIISITTINDFWAKFRFGFFERFLSKSQKPSSPKKKDGRKKDKTTISLFETRARDASRVIASSRATDDALTTSLLSISTHRKILTLLLFLLFCFFCF